MHAHPDIHGSNAELHFWDTGNFTEDFGSWLYSLSKAYGSSLKDEFKYIPALKHPLAKEVIDNVSTHGLYLTKAVFWGLVVLIENLRKIVAQPDFESHWISNATIPTIPEWLKQVKFIAVLCDPVKRMRSDFKHSQVAVHNNGRDWWTRRNGEVNARLYPFQNLTLEKFVRLFVKRAEKLPKESRIRRIIDMGQYASSDQIVPSVEKISEKKNFHLSDGGNFIGQPWEELIQIADFLEIDSSYFTKERFEQRSDGYYCILKTNIYLNMTKPKCLSSSKGRSAKKPFEISDATQRSLYQYYKDSNILLRKYRNFSWLDNF